VAKALAANINDIVKAYEAASQQPVKTPAELQPAMMKIMAERNVPKS